MMALLLDGPCGGAKKREPYRPTLLMLIHIFC